MRCIVAVFLLSNIKFRSARPTFDKLLRHHLIILKATAFGGTLDPSVELAVFSDVFCLGRGEDVGCGGVFLFDPSHEIINGDVEIIGQSAKGENIRLDVVIFILVYRLLADSDNTCKLLLSSRQ